MMRDVEKNIELLGTLRNKPLRTVATPTLVEEVVHLLATVADPRFDVKLSKARKEIKDALPHILRCCPSLAIYRARDGMDFSEIHAILTHKINSNADVLSKVTTAIASCNDKRTDQQPAPVR